MQHIVYLGGKKIAMLYPNFARIFRKDNPKKPLTLIEYIKYMLPVSNRLEVPVDNQVKFLGMRHEKYLWKDQNNTSTDNKNPLLRACLHVITGGVYVNIDVDSNQQRFIRPEHIDYIANTLKFFWTLIHVEIENKNFDLIEKWCPVLERETDYSRLDSDLMKDRDNMIELVGIFELDTAHNKIWLLNNHMKVCEVDEVDRLCPAAIFTDESISNSHQDPEIEFAGLTLFVTAGLSDLEANELNNLCHPKFLPVDEYEPSEPELAKVDETGHAYRLHVSKDPYSLGDASNFDLDADDGFLEKYFADEVTNPQNDPKFIPEPHDIEKEILRGGRKKQKTLDLFRNIEQYVHNISQYNKNIRSELRRRRPINSRRMVNIPTNKYIKYLQIRAGCSNNIMRSEEIRYSSMENRLKISRGGTLSREEALEQINALEEQEEEIQTQLQTLNNNLINREDVYVPTEEENEEIAELEAQIRVLTNGIGSLKAKQAITSSSIIEITEKIRHLRAMEITLNQELQNMNQEMENNELQEKLDELRDDWKELNDDVTSKKRQIADLEENAKNVENEILEKEQEINEINEDLRSLDYDVKQPELAEILGEQKQEYAKLDKEYELVQNKKKAEQDELTALEQEISIMKEKYKQLETDNANAVEDLDDMEKEIKALESEKETIKDQIGEATDELKKYTSQVDELETDIEKLKTEIKPLKDELDRISEEVAGKKNEHDAMRSENDQLEEEKLNIEDELQEQTKKFDDLVEELKALHESINDNSGLIRKKRNNIMDVNEKIEKTEKEIKNKDAERKIENTNLEKGTTKYKELLDLQDTMQEELDDLNDEIEYIMGQIKDQTDDNEALSDKIEEKEEQIDHKRTELNKYEELIDECNGRTNQIKKILDDKILEHDEVSKELYDLQEKEKSCVDNLSDEKEAVEDLNQLIEETNAELKQLTDEFKTCKDELEDKKREFDTLETERNQHLDDIEDAKNEIKNAKDAIEANKHKIKTLEDENDVLETEFNKIEGELQYISGEKEESQQTISDLTKEVQNTTAQIEQKHEILDESIDELQELENEISKLSSTQNTNTDRLKELDQKIKENKQEKTELDAEYNELITNKTTNQAELLKKEKQITEQESEITHLTEEYEEVMDSTKELEAKIKGHTDTIETQEARIKDLETKNSRQLDINKEKTAEMTDLVSQINNTNNIIGELRENLKNVNSSAQDLNTLQLNCADDIKQLENNAEAIETQLDKLNALTSDEQLKIVTKLKDLVANIDKKETEYQALTAQEQEHEETMAKNTAEINELQEEIQKITDRNTELESNLIKQKQELATLQEEMDDEQAKYDTFMEQIDDTTKELENVTQTIASSDFLRFYAANKDNIIDILNTFIGELEKSKTESDGQPELEEIEEHIDQIEKITQECKRLEEEAYKYVEGITGIDLSDVEAQDIGEILDEHKQKLEDHTQKLREIVGDKYFLEEVAKDAISVLERTGEQINETDAENLTIKELIDRLERQLSGQSDNNQNEITQILEEVESVAAICSEFKANPRPDTVNQYLKGFMGLENQFYAIFKNIDNVHTIIEGYNTCNVPDSEFKDSSKQIQNIKKNVEVHAKQIHTNMDPKFYNMENILKRLFMLLFVQNNKINPQDTTFDTGMFNDEQIDGQIRSAKATNKFESTNTSTLTAIICALFVNCGIIETINSLSSEVEEFKTKWGELRDAQKSQHDVDGSNVGQLRADLQRLLSNIRERKSILHILVTIMRVNPEIRRSDVMLGLLIAQHQGVEGVKEALSKTIGTSRYGEDHEVPFIETQYVENNTNKKEKEPHPELKYTVANEELKNFLNKDRIARELFSGIYRVITREIPSLDRQSEDKKIAGHEYLSVLLEILYMRILEHYPELTEYTINAYKIIDLDEEAEKLANAAWGEKNLRNNDRSDTAVGKMRDTIDDFKKNSEQKLGLNIEKTHDTNNTVVKFRAEYVAALLSAVAKSAIYEEKQRIEEELRKKNNGDMDESNPKPEDEDKDYDDSLKEYGEVGFISEEVKNKLYSTLKYCNQDVIKESLDVILGEEYGPHHNIEENRPVVINFDEKSTWEEIENLSGSVNIQDHAPAEKSMEIDTITRSRPEGRRVSNVLADNDEESKQN